MALDQATLDRARRLANVHPVTTAAEIVGVSHATLYRARKREWARAAGKLRPIPSDFALYARYMTNRELARHYHAGPPAIARWLKEKPRPRFKPGKIRQQEGGKAGGPTNTCSRPTSTSATVFAEGRHRVPQQFRRLNIAFPVGRGA